MAGYIGNVQSASLIDNNSVKNAVQNAADSNVFSDADHTKLDGIAAGATVASQPTIIVTVSGGKFVIDGTSQHTILMLASGVYKFDQSDSSNASHPLRISSTADGTHGGGSAITTDFVSVGTAGQAGAYVTFTIQQDGANTYYYYCANHSGMGGAIAKNHHSGDGNNHIPAAGAAGQLLQYASAGTAAWATISTGTPDIVFPSNWASPTSTYSSSGTWSKGSLADDAKVWFFLLGGGQGAARRTGGRGGTVQLVYGTASQFDGAAYVVGAGVTGQTTEYWDPVQGNQTTLTLSSSNGSRVYTTGVQSGGQQNDAVSEVIKEIPPVVSGTYLNGSPQDKYNITKKTLPSGYQWFFGMGVNYGQNIIFGGALGQNNYGSSSAASTSLLSGNGGASVGQNGTYPGGGGAAGDDTGQSGNGAAGNVRVYHV